MYNARPTSDGGYITGGYMNVGGTYAPFLEKLDGLGNRQWRKLVGISTCDQWIRCVRQTSDGGYVLGGTKDDLDFWLIKDLPGLAAAPPAKIKEAPIVLKDELANKPSPSTLTTSKPSSTGRFRITTKQESFEGKSIKSFTFNGRTEHVHHWEEVLTNLCDYFASTHNKDFEKVLDAIE